MLFWHKTTKNKKRELEEDLLEADLPTVLSDIEQEPDIKSGFEFSALLPEAAASLQSGCNYPLNIQNQFPVWSKIKDDETQPNLPDIVSEYYNWLTCATKSNITPEYGFFELENLKNINNLSKDFLILHSQIYIPSLPPDALNADVSQEELKNLLNGIYTKLYSYKGSEKSFKYLISHFFNINSNNVYIIHPKKYLMVLNGGRNSDISNTTTFYNTLGRLNYSIMPDNKLWNDYSYVVNTSNSEPNTVISDRFNALIRPLLHPAGLNGFYQEQKSFFEQIRDVVIVSSFETPLIYNYWPYVLTSINDQNQCFGCTFDNDGDLTEDRIPSFLFPFWAKNISDKYPSGVSFGSIQISDMFSLTSIDGSFPNDNRTCTGCP